MVKWTWWAQFGFLLVAFGVLLEGCTSGGAYQKDSEYVPYITDVPPSFYDNDPALRHWYTTPYWHPTANGE
jgi:hypothetical protein